MPDLSLQLMIAALTALPFVLLYWAARYVSRRKLGTAFRTLRPWQLPTLQAWAERGWLDPELAPALPGEVSPAEVFYEWAWIDPETAREWRFREPVLPVTPVEALVRDAWTNLSDERRRAARERLAEAVRSAEPWWGGAERGWNRRPLVVLAGAVGKKEQGLPLLPVHDLTGAPLSGPIRAQAMATEAEGPELVLALAALRQAAPRYTHPLAPRAGTTASLVEGLSTRVGSDVGRRVGAGLGAALGPIGSMVGQYLGEMAGRMGAKALTQPSLPEPVAAALQATESALASLGSLAETDDFARGARQPAEAVLEQGKRLELVREARSRRLRERIWPTAGLAAVEETLRVALRELSAYRAAADYFVATARKSPETVAGGMILQNPWLVRTLPGGAERLNAARAALNRAAAVMRKAS